MYSCTLPELSVAHVSVICVIMYTCSCTLLEPSVTCIYTTVHICMCALPFYYFSLIIIILLAVWPSANSKTVTIVVLCYIIVPTEILMTFHA